MRVLYHHIYEYKKGLRDLVLHTLPERFRAEAEEKLQSNNIPYIVRSLGNGKLNIFFGAADCIAIIAHFGDKPLHEFTEEEDFMLGIMLGYNRLGQCKRYLQRTARKRNLVHCPEPVNCYAARLQPSLTRQYKHMEENI